MGEPHVPPRDIAESLGLEPSSVRQWMSRGMRRLSRLAAEEDFAAAEELKNAISNQNDDDSTEPDIAE